MIRNIATLALAASIIVAAIFGWKVYAEKGRIAENEAAKAASEEAAAEMALKQEKLEADRVLNEMRLAEAKKKSLAMEEEIATQKRLEREAAAEEAKAKQEETKAQARKAEAQMKANHDARAAEADRLKAAKYEAEKAAKELEIAEKAENKAKLEAKKAEDEAAITKYALEDLLAAKAQYETLIQDNETLRAELKELIEAHKPEMTAKDLVSLEEGEGQVEVEGEGLSRGEAALKKAEKDLLEREEKRRASVQAETLEKLEKLLQESVKNGEVIDAEFYLKIIKGVK